jgi:hypothetical protein
VRNAINKDAKGVMMAVRGRVASLFRVGNSVLLSENVNSNFGLICDACDHVTWAHDGETD